MLKKPQCLQLSKFYPPVNGGIENVVKFTSEGLVQKGWHVDVLCANTRNKTVVDTGIIQVIRLASLGVIASTSILPSLFSWLRKIQNNYDVIHVHLPNPMANLALFITRPKSKIILHWHSDVVNQKILLRLYSPLQKWLLQRADAIICTTETYAKSSPWLKKNQNKIFYVSCSIPDKKPQADEKLNGSLIASLRSSFGNSKIILAVGRLVYYKGFDILIKSVSYLKGDVVVLVIGSGELERDLFELSEKLGVSSKVKFLGRVNDSELSLYYQAADIFCLPSIVRSEAFGLVIVEAMSYGKPIVATNIPGSGVSWVNQNGVTGLNAEPGNILDLAKCLQLLLDNQNLAKEFGRAARERFEKNFTVEEMVCGTLKVYESCISN